MSKPKTKKAVTKVAEQAASVLPVLADDEQFLQDAAERIKERLVNGHEAIVEIGRDLCAVKERLGTGISWHGSRERLAFRQRWPEETLSLIIDGGCCVALLLLAASS
jgi:hypothetical protein